MKSTGFPFHTLRRPPLFLATIPSSCGFDPLADPPGPVKKGGYALAEDLDPDPATVEVRLKARAADWDPGNGVPIHGFGFNGMVPGSLIQANVDDKIVVHLKNSLAEPTTIHWHGLRIPNSSGMMSGMMGETDPPPAEPRTPLTPVYNDAPTEASPEPVIPVVQIPAWIASSSVAHRSLLDESMMSVTFDGETRPDEPVLSSPEGTYTFEIQNKSGTYHPMHFHGIRLQVVGLDGASVQSLAWKDTVSVPPGSALTLAMALDNPGRWLYHCHILEHEEAGMKGELDILSPATSAPQ